MRAIVNVSEFLSPAVASLCKYWMERDFAPPNGLGEAIAETYRSVAEFHMPAVGHYGYPALDGNLVMSEFAVLPVSNDGIVNQCLAIDHLDVRSEYLPG